MPSSASDYLKGLVGTDVTITSGDRTPQRNRLVGGTVNSAHLKPGTAYDFVPKGISTKDAASRIAKSQANFDQVIDENDHVHVSFDPKNRRQVIPSKMAQPDPFDVAFGSSKSAPPPSPQAAASMGTDPFEAAFGGGKSSPTGTHQNPPIGFAPPPASKGPGFGGTLADMIRSAPGALVKGGAMVAGLPGDVNELFDSGMNALTGANVSTRNFPTSQEIGNTIAKPFGGFYEPKTTAGKYVDTALQFAPAALAPGSAGLRAARVAAPGIASEAAGQATEGSPMEPVARVLGAVAGGAGLGMAKNALLAPKKVPIPTTSEIKTAADAAYKAAEQAGVVVKNTEVKNLAKSIAQDVTDAGIDETLHPKATAALNRLLKSKGDLSFKKVEILRRVANSAAGSIDADEARIAHIIVDRIDDFVENLGPSHVRAGNTQVASDSIKDARSLWAKKSKSSVIDNLVERAKNRAENQGGSGFENALRVEFRGLAQNAKRMARFTPDEQKAIQKVVRGGPIANFAKTMGKLYPTNLMAMLGEMGAMHFNPAAIALPIAGSIGRGAATIATKGNVNKLSELVRSGKKPPQAPSITPETISAILSRKGEREKQNNLIPSFAQ